MKMPNSEPHEIEAKNINPYLIDASDLVISSRSKPLSDVPEMFLEICRMTADILLFI